MNAIVVFGPIKAIVAFVGFIYLSILCARGAFASPEKLLSMSKWIGTKNPVLARLVCLIGLLVFTVLGIGILVIFISS